MTLSVCSMTAEASDAKKYSISLSSSGWNSEVESERGNTGISPRPWGLCSIWTTTEARKHIHTTTTTDRRSVKLRCSSLKIIIINVCVHSKSDAAVSWQLKQSRSERHLKEVDIYNKWTHLLAMTFEVATYPCSYEIVWITNKLKKYNYN